MVASAEKHMRKPGRPRAIARVLRKEYGLNPDYTSVRRTLVRLGKVNKGSRDKRGENDQEGNLNHQQANSPL